MARFKQTGRQSPDSTADSRAQAERLSRSLSESAQQIWLAGIGAFGRAQAEGTKLFEALVKEGMHFEHTARKFAGGGAEVMRDVVESSVGQARERATDTFGRLEKVFEDRVHRALVKLGIPGREDLAELSRRVETLTRELRRQGNANASVPRKAAAKKTVAKARPAVKAPAGRTRSAASVPAGKPRRPTTS